MLPVRTAAARVAAVVAVLASAAAFTAGPAHANDEGTNSVHNVGSYGSIGIMHLFDGNYTRGNYDQLLPEDRWSDDVYPWSFTEGVYIGPGYCAIMSSSFDGTSRWGTSDLIKGPIKFKTDRIYFWKVNAFPLPSSGKCSG